MPFTTHTSIRKLQRKYCIESIDKYLPAGSLTIREQDHLVGVTKLPNMAVGDKHTFNAGQDPDVSRRITHIAIFSLNHSFRFH